MRVQRFHPGDRHRTKMKLTGSHLRFAVAVMATDHVTVLLTEGRSQHTLAVLTQGQKLP